MRKEFLTQDSDYATHSDCREQERKGLKYCASCAERFEANSFFQRYCGECVNSFKKLEEMVAKK